MYKKLTKIANFNILLLFLLFNSISRISLMLFSYYEEQIDFFILPWSKTLAFGFFNDIVTAFYFLAPISILTLLIPFKKSKFIKFFAHIIYFLLIIGLGFLIISEFTFWLEFSTRFNFIAVDYLVYTNEVIGNVVQSYPIIWIFSLLFLFSAFVYYKVHPRIKSELENILKLKERFVFCLSFALFAIVSFSFYNPKITDIGDNNFLSELSKNGLYNLFSAFRNNSIEYPNFYSTAQEDSSFKRLSNFITVSDQELLDPNFLKRHVNAKGPKNNYNVVLITLESLSSSFLNDIINGKSITPVINDLITKSRYFDNFYATGTRTVRGLEAITLSIPPIPGQSIVRRPNNEKLFSIATILKQENYDLKFIYGGYGYFDNMTKFFSKNNFKVIDRSDVDASEIEFENIWGISDEDLYKQVIKQADISFKNNNKFFSFVMTTSNHRPYTYPEGKIDIPSKQGRHGGVKYADYALGEFLKASQSKPWFNNTIFVITADHCAGSAGKIALPPEKYHIPLLIYAPSLIKPEVIPKMAGQIDLAPTILGLLNIDYESRFFGNDIMDKKYQNAFISTYQKLGYIENNKLIVLSPGKIENTYDLLQNRSVKQTKNEISLVDRAIDYYQSAYYLFTKGNMKEDAQEY